MNMWLNAASKINGPGRSLWTVELMRQQRLLTSEPTKQSVRLLADAWNLPRRCKLEE